ncbi:hypothetical protein [Aurantiacibacter rhizosphaerae]|uniref:Uncharacterized protein n=1 Tax=Aurantiacibacter rhizosphaerae TaxID=2691582 RepID=A0A844XET7_9SPHN|nr:hypothetical protein [Aurantiacibacter rhizosphaerae]MWV28263.1 hypothetical protein [Aurantiacibacter rhizosphaerae]
MSGVIGPDSPPQDVWSAISSEYHRPQEKNEVPHVHGWSYLSTPLARRDQPKLVTIGLKPGGEWDVARDGPIQEDLSAEGKEPDFNAYFDQPWNNTGFTPLQTQIQNLHKLHFQQVPKDEILSFQYIPFRSPTWNEFPAAQRQRAARFGTHLLDWTLANIGLETTVVGFGLGVVQDRIESWFRVIESRDIEVGWGNITATVCETPKCKRLILLPHLSRYQIIGRKEFVRADEVFQ